MYVFIYSVGPLRCGLDELEDALDEAFRDKGEVTGSGTGESGSNIDLEITDAALTVDNVLSLVRETLRRFPIPESTRIDIEGEKYDL